MALGDFSDPIPIKQNDTRPVIQAYVKQGTAGTAVDLTGATAVFNMRGVTGTDEGNLTVGTVVANRAAATIPTPTAGLLRFVPTTAQTATNGLYQAEFELTLSDTGVLTVPTGSRYIYIRVGDDIA